MKKFMSFALTLCMVLSLAACGSEPESEKNAETDAPKTETGELFIGVVTKSLADQHWALVKAGAESKAKELGVRVSVTGPNSESDIQAQVDMIDNLIGQEVDALCVAPCSQDAVLTPFKTADEAGIPILTIDTDTTFENRLAFIGTGNEAAAFSGGEVAAKAVGEGAKAVIIRGRLGDATHDQRQKGFEDALKAAGIEILDVKAADSDSEKAMNVMQDLYQVYDQIDLVCTTTDNMAYGIQRAIEASGEGTLQMSFDGTTTACELILEDKMLGSVAQNPFAMGELAVENAVRAIQGESVEARIDSGSEVVIKENAQSYLDNLAALAG